jgi:hypothetical protein
MKKTLACLLIAAATASLRSAELKLTYPDLVKRLTDLEALATLPVPGEQCAQWSSYDRKSRYDQATGKYVGWDANGDGHGIIRKEGDQQVLAEMEGPGCIWRIWSATPKQGRVRIYLDGKAQPAVDLPFIQYFDQSAAPFTRPALVHTVAKGWNNYTPIPYQKSCKIVAEPGWGDYFQFTYSTFPKGTQVPTFQLNLSPADMAALDLANRTLESCGARDEDFRDAIRGKSSRAMTEEFTEVVRLEGPAAITAIRLRTETGGSPRDPEPLRSATIQICWDGEAEPSVWSPLGDFFGTAPGKNPYRSLPLGLADDGWWYCKWFMPFAKSAEITFKKEGPHPLKLEYEIASRPLRGEISRYGRFHAKWHRDVFLPPEPERWIDWPIVKTEGAGRFLGVMLHVWNPRGGWWGEGDEKFFVDGEKFPSTIGTGSEDYFGYAWCNPGLFQNAYHNQTRNDGNNRGHVSVNRWHIADNIPFQKSFEGYIEKYYPNQRPTLYAATAYWYLSSGGKDPYQPVPLNERIGYFVPVQPTRVPGAIEGESLKVLSKTGGGTEEQDLTGFEGQWSNDAHLWWTQARPGHTLELAVPVAQSGRYALSLHLTKARDYGIVQLYLDGKKLGDPIDLFNPQVIPSGPIRAGVHDLTAGEHTLKVEIVGANPKAIKSYMFGLDYLKLEPAPQAP